LDAVEKLEKRGVVKTWSNRVESEHPCSKPFQSACRQRGWLRCRFSDPPKSLFVCRVHDPTNFGSMPEMEFFNGILEFCTRAIKEPLLSSGVMDIGVRAAVVAANSTGGMNGFFFTAP
jgi:hypothetical protein